MNEKDRYFETIKCDKGKIYNVKYHQNRIDRTISKNINLQNCIYPPDDKLYKCKVIYTINDIESIVFSLYKKKEIYNFKILFCDNIVYDNKSLNRNKIDSLYQKKDIADEIIIIKDGYVTDTSIANIAIYENRQWFTPKKPLLYGTTRDRYVNEGILKEENISIQRLKEAQKIALLNAMIDFDILDDNVYFV